MPTSFTDSGFINRDNLVDVRKLELASKRTLVSDGVFGLTDGVLGGFTVNLEGRFQSAAVQLRTRAQVEADFQQVLTLHEEENQKAVSATVEVLFTTFTRELAQKVNLSPRYISKRADELNETLWRLAKSFFLRYNETNTDCVFVIDEEAKTVTLTGGGIRREVPVLCGVTGSGRTLSQGGCEAVLSLPVKDFAEEGSRSPHWLKRGGEPRELDKMVPAGALLERENKKLSPAQAEEMERMKLRYSGQKAALARKLDALEVKVKALEAEREAVIGDRLKRLALEKQVKQFVEQEKLTARSRRSS